MRVSNACINIRFEPNGAGIPITTPAYWVNEAECTDEVLGYVFRSTTSEKIPLLEDRILCLREAGKILHDVSFLAYLPEDL